MAFANDILRQVARLLMDNFRTPDAISRWEDDQLMIMLPHTPEDSTGTIAARVQGEISTGITSHAITVSMGIAQVRNSVNDAVKIADQNLRMTGNRGEIVIGSNAISDRKDGQGLSASYGENG